MKIFTLFFLLFSTLMVTRVVAQSTTNLMVLGPGTESCGSWIVHRRQQTSLPDQMWVEGYITASEVATSAMENKSLNINTDSLGIYGWLDNYCAANPSIDLIMSINEFIIQTRPFVSAP